MTTHKMNIGLTGGGRMGGMLIREIAQADDLHLVAATQIGWIARISDKIW